MADKPKLILHIGTHKTATTTLQALMHESRDFLDDQGICYPATDRPPHPEHPKHNSLMNALLQGGRTLERERRIVMEEFEASGAHTLLMSGEGLSSPRLRMAGEVDRIQRFAEGFDITIVCFLRRQDTFIESMWNQLVKSGRSNSHITDFVADKQQIEHMTYLNLLEAWGRNGTIRVEGFEAAVEKGVVESFCDLAGVGLPLSPRPRNVSPSMGAAAVLAGMARLDIPADWRLVDKALGPDARRTALGSRLRQEILARFAEHNQRLKDDYGVEFPTTLPEEPEDPVAMPTGAELTALAPQVKPVKGLRAKAGGRKGLGQKALGRKAGGQKGAGQKGAGPGAGRKGQAGKGLRKAMKLNKRQNADPESQG